MINELNNFHVGEKDQNKALIFWRP